MVQPREEPAQPTAGSPSLYGEVMAADLSGLRLRALGPGVRHKFAHPLSLPLSRSQAQAGDMVVSAPLGASPLLWLLASEDWPGHWAGLQAEVIVSHELIWAGSSQQTWLLLWLPRGGARGAVPVQGGRCVCAYTRVWVEVHV